MTTPNIAPHVAGQTPVHGLPWPGDEEWADGPSQLQALAEATEAAILASTPPPAPGVPAGLVQPFAGPAANIPAGWLLCNGAAVNRTTFAALFAAIGTTYGVGDGSTTFNVPNMMNGRTVIGADATSPHGSAGGARTHTLTQAEMPAHTHGLSSAATWRYPNGTGNLAAGTEFRSFGTGVPTSDAAGGGGAHNNMPPFVAMQWIIRT